MGIAVGLGLLFGAYLWWDGHRPEKPWNDKAITASFLRSSVTNDSFFLFYYSLKNNTDHDYRSSPPSEMRTLGKTKEGDLTACDGCIDLAEPIFIPAHDQAQIHLTLKYKYLPGPLPPDETGRDLARKALEDYLNNQFARVNGFVIFDEVLRYKINLPPGWKK